MASAFAKDLSLYPVSISGDQIAKNIIQVGQSDGVDPISLDHDFYGISTQGTVFSLASFRVVESGPNTNTGTLELHIYNSEGVSVPVLSIGEDGTTISGSFNVKGGNTSFETTSVVVEDKDMQLASGASSLQDIDQAGILVGTPDSGVKSMLYDSAADRWNLNAGVNLDEAAAFTIGGTKTVLDAAGLTVGEVNLTAESLRFSSDVSLETGGLEIGHLSITPLGGIVLESTNDDESGTAAPSVVVIDQSGVSVGSEIHLTDTGLSLGTDALLEKSGLYLKNAASAVYLGETGWKIAYDSSSQHLVFEYYDTDSQTYVTKAEIKS